MEQQPLCTARPWENLRLYLSFSFTPSSREVCRYQDRPSSCNTLSDDANLKVPAIARSLELALESPLLMALERALVKLVGDVVSSWCLFDFYPCACRRRSLWGARRWNLHEEGNKIVGEELSACSPSRRLVPPTIPANRLFCRFYTLPYRKDPTPPHCSQFLNLYINKVPLLEFSVPYPY